MTYEIHNWGVTKALPYKNMAIRLPRHSSIWTDDKELAAKMEDQKEITVRPSPSGSDGDMTRNELMQKAKSLGIEVSRRDTREDLLSRLESEKGDN